MDKLLILIPSFNEEKNLPEVLGELLQVKRELYEKKVDADILVIDDGSEDQTTMVARKANVSVLQLPVNVGYGAALQSGFLYATDKDYDLVVSIDADGQHQPPDIIKLVDAFIKDPHDVILGSRFIVDTGYETNLPRRMGIKLFSVVLKMLSGKHIADVTTGFQLLTRPVVRLFATEYPHDYPDAQMLLLLALSGFRIKEIPVVVKQRLHGQSMHSSFKSIFYPVRNLLAIVVIMLRIPQVKQNMAIKTV